jgi:putative ABC transport system permease protein
VLASLNERRRELAILRANGARPRDVLALLLMEGLGTALTGAALGVLLLGAAAALLAPWLLAEYGIPVQAGFWREGEAVLLGWVCLAALVASLLPAWRAYRLSLADGLTPRI